ncbi:hypothetical protein D9758_014015 [Tetrapyrgos nigripes]|uniref:Uncharacterized protein n=1 Tax=Tetrapyrgos nigripes TaxID=182062 RepID=A0A8H5D0A9_9AGAR|nr:hypothetical protein D9758_014015 [Tetrapyrgos nigripes]
MSSPGQFLQPSRQQIPVISALIRLFSSPEAVARMPMQLVEAVRGMLIGTAAGWRWNSAGKVLLWILLIANARALPFVWHVRVFRPLIYVRFEQLFVLAKSLFASKKEKERIMEEWIESISPVGRNPLKHVVVYKSFASFDECDYNLHLSNSSYAKALDGARFKLARELFTQFLRVGGHMPLAATHFHFIKEIPVMSSYEVRVSLGSWDEKWVYILCRFLTKNKPGHTQSKSSLSRPNKRPSFTSPSPSMFDHAPITDSGTPSLSSSATPNSGRDRNIVVDTGSSRNDTETNIDQTIRTLTSQLTQQSQSQPYSTPFSSRLPLEDDTEEGYTLHTVTVSLMCFKIGRITIPPVLVMAASGLCTPPSPPAYPGKADAGPGPGTSNTVSGQGEGKGDQDVDGKADAAPDPGPEPGSASLPNPFSPEDSTYPMLPPGLSGLTVSTDDLTTNDHPPVNGPQSRVLHDITTNPTVTLTAASPLSPSEPPKGTTMELALPKTPSTAPSSPEYPYYIYESESEYSQSQPQSPATGEPWSPLSPISPESSMRFRGRAGGIGGPIHGFYQGQGQGQNGYGSGGSREGEGDEYPYGDLNGYGYSNQGPTPPNPRPHSTRPPNPSRSTSASGSGLGLPYTHKNPPPHWKWVLKTISPPHGGSVKKMNRLMRGDWRGIPEDVRVRVKVPSTGTGIHRDANKEAGEHEDERKRESAYAGIASPDSTPAPSANGNANETTEIQLIKAEIPPSEGGGVNYGDTKAEGGGNVRWRG